MSSNQFFIYQIFWNYYENKQNPDILHHNNKIYYYYYDQINNIFIKKFKQLPNLYIIYNNISIFIEFLGNNDILFIIPRQVGPDLFGDHFHIGPMKTSQKNLNRSKPFNFIANNFPIFLHWSLQDTIKQERNMFSKCTIRDRLEDLADIENILCTNIQNKLFKDKFNTKFNATIHPSVNPILNGLSPHDLNLLAIIKHILRRPFYPLHLAGGALYQIFTGPRGGKYVLKNNKKIYL
jgi:hypothetical protein